MPRAVEAQSPNRWIAREFPTGIFLVPVVREAQVLLVPSTTVKFMQVEGKHVAKNQAGAGCEERLVRVELWGWGAVALHS